MNHDELKMALKKFGWSDRLIDAHFPPERQALSFVTDNDLVYLNQTVYEMKEPILRVDSLQNLAVSQSWRI